MPSENKSLLRRIKMTANAAWLGEYPAAASDEATKDYGAAEAICAALRLHLPEPAARAAMLGAADAIFRQAAGSPGSKPDRARCRAMRTIGTLTHEAAQLPCGDGQPDLHAIYIWQAAIRAHLEDRRWHVHWRAV